MASSRIVASLLASAVAGKGPRLVRTLLVRPLATGGVDRRMTRQLSSASKKTKEEKENVYRSIWPDVTIPEVSIPEYIFRDFDKHGNKPALISALTGKQKTFAEVRDDAWRIASSLTRLGFRRNERLLAISENSVEYILVFYAVVWIGGTISMVNPNYPTDEIVRQAVDADVSYIFTSKNYASKSLDVVTLLRNKIKKVFVADGEASGCLPMSLLLSDDGSSFPKDVQFDPRSQLALLPFSSGTTGLPKGVMLSHYNMVAITRQTDISTDPRPLLERETAINLGLLPFYHIYGIMVNVLISLYYGQTMVVIPEFNPQLFVDTIKKYRVTVTYVAPPVVLFLNKHRMAAEADLSSLSQIICSAAPLAKEMVVEFHSKQPHCILAQAYGLTETSPAVSVNPTVSCRSKPASSGLVFPNTLVKILDTNTGAACEKGVRGEVCVKGPQVMLGYLNNKKSTEETLDPEGWLRTGDVGYLDDDNHLYIVDRAKELIKYKGFQVPPAELEAALCSHEAVADAGVIGIPDPDAGEVPKAFVSLKPDRSVSAEELEKYVSSIVVSYKRLRGGISFIERIPRSATGKILRKDLKQAKGADTPASQ